MDVTMKNLVSAVNESGKDTVRVLIKGETQSTAVQAMLVAAGWLWANGAKVATPSFASGHYVLCVYVKEKVLRHSISIDVFDMKIGDKSSRSHNRPAKRSDDHFGYLPLTLKPLLSFKRVGDDGLYVYAAVARYSSEEWHRIYNPHMHDLIVEATGRIVFKMEPFRPGQTAYYHKDNRTLTYISTIDNNTFLYYCEYTGMHIPINRGGVMNTGHQAYAIPRSILYYIYRKFYNSNSPVQQHTISGRLPHEWGGWFAKHDLHYDHPEILSLAAWCERRTNMRINEGTYYEVPQNFPRQYGTGVHLSTLDDKLLAFYPTKRNIIDDIPQRIKPGRYLKKYFPTMTDDEVRIMTAKVLAGTELQLFDTGEDIIRLYMELHHSGVVASCMSKTKWKIHPLMVYDNSDVGLAVMFQGGEPKARALFNKNNKQYPMIYGQWEKMKVLLDKNGFEHGDLDGAKIKRIPIGNGNGIVMPYIDGHRKLDRSENNSTKVDVFEDHCVISKHGAYAANEYERAAIDVTGSRAIYDNDPGSDEDDEDDSYCDCEHCGDNVHEDSTYWISYGDIRVCESCYENEVIELRQQGTRSTVSALNERNFIEINERYYEDIAAVEYWGYHWSDYHDEYVHEDHAVYVEDANDWYSEQEIGQSVWLTRDGYYTTESVIDEAFYDGELNMDNEGHPLKDLKAHYRTCPSNLDPMLWDKLEDVTPPEDVESEDVTTAFAA